VSEASADFYQTVLAGVCTVVVLCCIEGSCCRLFCAKRSADWLWGSNDKTSVVGLRGFLKVALGACLVVLCYIESSASHGRSSTSNYTGVGSDGLGRGMWCKRRAYLLSTSRRSTRGLTAFSTGDSSQSWSG
jgi:hypothetical protein